MDLMNNGTAKTRKRKTGTQVLQRHCTVQKCQSPQEIYWFGGNGTKPCNWI
jgi:hypothetical protein